MCCCDVCSPVFTLGVKGRGTAGCKGRLRSRAQEDEAFQQCMKVISLGSSFRKALVGGPGRLAASVIAAHLLLAGDDDPQRDSPHFL